MNSRRAPDAVALDEIGGEDPHWLPRDCPVAATLAVLGGKWKPSILYLLCRGDTRLRALQRALPGITQRMLTLQSRVLENDGLVERHVDGSVPPQVEYALTPRGRTLGPVMETLGQWGVTHLSRTVWQAPAGSEPGAGDDSR